MILVQVILCLLLAGLIGFALVVAENSIRITWAYLKFKRKLKGIKIADGFSPLDGHLRSIVFKPFLIHHVAELCEKYGKTFGYMFGRVPSVMTHDLDLIKRLLVDERALNRMTPQAPVREMITDNILLAHESQWRHLRRSIAPAFKSNRFKTPNVLREIDGSIAKFVRALEVKLDASETGARIVVNMDDMAHRYSLDLALSCLYKQSGRVDFLADEDSMTKLVDEGLEATMENPMILVSLACPALRALIDWLVMNFHPQGSWRRLLMMFIKEQTRSNLEARKQMNGTKLEGKQVDEEEEILLENGTKFSRNMVDAIIDQFHEGKLTQSEYFHSSWFLLGAADKTSADSIVHTLYRLAVDQDIQDRLRASIQEHGSESEYLGWVLNESLRLLPPAPLGCSRIVERDLEDSDGRLVPAGTALTTPAYSIHRLEAYWGPDADQFRPERFADTTSFHPFQFIPFGAGGRMCPGREFALFEIKRLLCALLSRYTFHCEPTEMRYNSPIFLYTLSEKPTLVSLSRL